jgi:hypothetical protein
VRDVDAERRRCFDALFNENIADIDAYCQRRAGSPSDAQDAAGEVFLIAPRDREVLLLAEREGLTAAEIAVVVHRPAVTVRGRLHRARRRFRAAFEASPALSADRAPSPADASRLERFQARPAAGPATPASSLRKELHHANGHQSAGAARHQSAKPA